MYSLPIGSSRQVLQHPHSDRVDRGKVFAIGGWQDHEPSFTFKVTDISYEVLRAQPGLRPAPYLASRGMTWIQHFGRPGLSDDELEHYIRQSHLIVSQGLSRKKQIELGLVQR